jgi:hypothetical protein
MAQRSLLRPPRRRFSPYRQRCGPRLRKETAAAPTDEYERIDKTGRSVNVTPLRRAVAVAVAHPSSARREALQQGKSRRVSDAIYCFLLHGARLNKDQTPWPEDRVSNIEALGGDRSARDLIRAQQFARRRSEPRGLEPERCGSPFLFDRVKKLASQAYRG